MTGWDISPEATQSIASVGARPARDIDDMVQLLVPPRTIWVMVPSDRPEPVNETLGILQPRLTEGDLVIDGGNSKYTYAQGRADFLAQRGIHFMDFGVSGGPGGARDGAAVMIGGSIEDFERTQWLAKIIAAPDAYTHIGPVGSGHFAKMVHNGIEYGMMQAIAEGYGVLKGGPFDLDLAKVTRAYKGPTVISSRLIDWVFNGLSVNPTLEGISSIIGHSGEGEWALEQARKLGLELPAIQAAFDRRVNSPQDPKDSLEGFINRIVNLQRNQFGGHNISGS